MAEKNYHDSHNNHTFTVLRPGSDSGLGRGPVIDRLQTEILLAAKKDMLFIDPTKEFEYRC